MKVLLLGSTGMIGHKIFQVLSKNKKLNLFNMSKSRLNQETILIDLLRIEDLIENIEKIQPDVIINAAGILIEDSELKPLNSIKLNATLPLTLSEISNRYRFKLIQISTDCVISGKDGPYLPHALRDAYNVYGKTKALGEVNDRSNLTIRTSVIGPDLASDGKELFNWFMNQSGVINGYSKSMWSGVTTIELAKCVEFCILNKKTGINNLTSGTAISKYELLRLINKLSGKNLTINKIDGPSNNKVLLSQSPFFYDEPQVYSELIKKMIDDITESKIYSNYKFKNI